MGLKFKDFSTEALANIPKAQPDDLHMLWHSDYWDGPRSGLLLYRGQKLWFEVFDELDGGPIYRRFLIVELSPEQLREEENWHELFRQKVGTHTDYDATQNRQLGALRPREMWHEFYDAYHKRTPLDLSNDLVVAWFEH